MTTSIVIDIGENKKIAVNLPRNFASLILMFIMIICDIKIVLCIRTLLNQLLINELAHIENSCFADF